jgi:hypothetical protein
LALDGQSEEEEEEYFFHVMKISGAGFGACSRPVQVCSR